MVKKGDCKKHSIPLSNGVCLICSSIKNVQNQISQAKKDTIDSIQRKKNEMKKARQEGKNKVELLSKKIMYYESNAKRVFEDMKKQEDEISKVVLKNE